MFIFEKKSHGFTLIELLGVLVVLLIISLITLPTINDSVEKSKKDSLKISANNLFEAGKEYGVNHYDDLQNDYEKIFTISDGEFEDNRLSIKGSLPTGGQIGVLSDGNVAIAINDGKWCAKKDYNSDIVTISSDLDNCFISQGFIKTPESCFDFDSLTGTITGYHPYDSECPKIVAIPSTIDGTTVSTIGDQAFFVNGLWRVSLPNTLVSIGDSAFGSNLISNINIPSSVTHIGKAAFNNNMLPDNQAIIYARNADGTIDNTTIVSYGGKNRGDSIVIPNTVTTIGDQAFDMYNWHWRLDNESSNVFITNITIPDSVITIGNGAFQTSALESLTLGNSITTIGDYAFSGYSEGGTITSLVIPDSVTSIGVGAFYWHTSLSNVTLGNQLVSIKEKAFYMCGLSNITIPSSVTTIETGSIVGNGAFYSNNFNSSSVVTIKYNTTNLAHRFDADKSNIGWGTATMQYVSD